MQYTLRNIPPHLDQALREKANREYKSLNEVAIEALSKALGLTERPIKFRDLSTLAGSWQNDGEIAQALAEQRTIDAELWQ